MSTPLPPSSGTARVARTCVSRSSPTDEGVTLRYAGTNSTPDSTTALSRLGAVMVASSRSSSFQMLARSVSPGTPHRRTGRRRSTPGSRHRPELCNDRLASDAVRAQAVRDRTRKTRRRGEFGIRVQRIAVPAQTIQQRLLRQDRQRHLQIRRRSGGATDVDGPRSPPNPPSPRAKIDRFVLHNGLPSRSVTDVSLTITAALPLSQTSVNRVTDRAEPLAGGGAARSPPRWHVALWVIRR